MPSALHQGLVRLFEEQPGLVRELLGSSLGLPEGPLAPLSTDLTEHKPSQLQADVVVGIAGPDGPQAVLVVEIQLQKNANKPRVWPHYVTSSWRRFGCPVALVVVALANRESERAVELTVLALDALGGVSADAATIYGDTLFASLPEPARRALEDLMAQGHYEFQSDFAKKYFKQGREQGREEGREQEAREARRSTLLAVLGARGIALDQATRDRIETTDDVEQLQAWIALAAVATTAAAVFGESAD